MTRPRFPLAAKFAAWLVLNLALLAGLGWWFARDQFAHGFDSVLAATAAPRVEALAAAASAELRATPRAQWDEVLARLSTARGVDVSAYRNSGEWMAGPKQDLPAPVLAKLTRPATRAGREGPPPVRDGPPGFRPPRRDGPPGEAGPRPLSEELADARRWPKELVPSTHPSAYWIIVRAPVDDGWPPQPASLIFRVPSLIAGRLLVEPRPLLVAAGGALVVSVLFWLPFVLGLTRHLRRVTAATAEVARGNFSVRVPEKSRDELGALAASVNTMSGQLDALVTGQRRFLGDVAHELCSPVARMQAALAILEQRARDEKQARYLGAVREELDAMGQLVDELLHFSKAGVQRDIALGPVPLAPLVAEVLAREAPGAQVECAVPAALTARAEPRLLARALGNVLRNALRYAGPAGPITIHAAPAGAHLALTIADRGPGVPPESLPRLFDAFYRPDAARARETGGAGLGLAIVKTCLEACGGRVAARNRPGGGLEITFTLAAA
jgi:two-component system sensor histidine kinase CpxA